MGRFDGILIASDFDRTLTDPAGIVPDANREALRRFMDEGGRFSVASGRSVPMFRCKRTLFESNAPTILFNGAACYDFEAERVVFGTPLPRMDELIAEALRRYPLKNCELQGIDRHCTFLIEQERIDMFCSLGVELYDKPYAEVDDPMYMLFLGDEFIRPDDPKRDFQSSTPEVDAMFDVCNAWISSQGPFSAVRSTRRNTEVMMRGVSKGSAARRLAETLGCKTLVCVGDAMNDLAMLEEADYSFTPADGDEQIRTILGEKLRVTKPCGVGALAGVIAALQEIL